MPGRFRYSLTFFLMIIAQTCFGQQTVRQVFDKILSELNTSVNPGSVDTLKSGSWDVKVTGIACTFMATLDVLKQAKEKGANLILTHEPTYYNHWDDKTAYGANDPIIEAKRKFIEENGLVVLRFHDVPHQVADDMIFKGVMDRLAWNDYYQGGAVFKMPETTLEELARQIAKTFNSSTVRVVGDRKMKVLRVGLRPGAAPSQWQVDGYNQDIDVLVVGESREWETIEYARDAQEMGIQKGLIVMGHADSEEPGMEFVTSWLEQRFPKTPVYFIPAKNPLWTVD